MTLLRELNPDFRDLLLAFAAQGVEFVVVGAYALALHGVPRFTGDLDVFVRPSAENARKVWEALASFGAPVDAAGVQPSDFATPGIVYQIGLPPARVDVLTEISGVTFDEAWATRERRPRRCPRSLHRTRGVPAQQTGRRTCEGPCRRRAAEVLNGVTVSSARCLAAAF
jgi:hypothetical protein